MTTQELYLSLLKEETTKNDFMYQIRRDPKLSYCITPLLSYEDSIQILKNKGIITENTMQDDKNSEQPRSKRWSKNPSWDAMSRLDKKAGLDRIPGYVTDDDLEDEAVVNAYSGQGEDAFYPNKAFSMNEDVDSYGKALNSVIEKMQGGKQDIIHAIDVATAEFDLSDEERTELEIDAADWKNQVPGAAIDDENPRYEGDGIDEEEIPGGVGDNTDPESLNRRELEIGISVEMEHTDNPSIAKEIAVDHLTEDPQYYSKFQKTNLRESFTSPFHNTDVKKTYPQFDNLRFNQLLRGARYEYELSNKKDWDKSYEKAGNNLLKDSLYYVYKMNNIKKSKKRTDLDIPVKGKNFVDKANATTIVAGSKNNKQSRLKSGNKPSPVKYKAPTEMTQKPKRAKGIKQVMDIPGKEKKVKLNESKLNILAGIIKEEVENLLKKKVNEQVDTASAMRNIAQNLASKPGIAKDEIIDYIISLRNGDESKYNELTQSFPQIKGDIDSIYKISLNEDHLNNTASQIQYILQNKDHIKQAEQITPEYLESQSTNFIAKLYQKLETKVKENDALGGAEPEFTQLQENEDDLLTEDEVKLQEIKGLEITPGETFDIQGDLGKFKRGEKVTVKAVNTFGQEIQFTLRNETGVEDTFIMDVNDKFEDDEPVNEINIKQKNIEKLSNNLNSGKKNLDGAHTKSKETKNKQHEESLDNDSLLLQKDLKKYIKENEHECSCGCKSKETCKDKH